VKRRVEYRDVLQPRERSSRTSQNRDRGRKMQRCQPAQCIDLVDGLVVQQRRIGETLTTVHDPVHDA
jgi:hypothetical protein